MPLAAFLETSFRARLERLLAFGSDYLIAALTPPPDPRLAACPSRTRFEARASPRKIPRALRLMNIGKKNTLPRIPVDATVTDSSWMLYFLSSEFSPSVLASVARSPSIARKFLGDRRVTRPENATKFHRNYCSTRFSPSAFPCFLTLFLPTNQT